MWASQKIFSLQDPRRISVVFEPPVALEEEEKGEEEGKEEDQHRTHPLEGSHPEVENEAPSRRDPTKELAHPQLLETETDWEEEAD